MSERIMRKRIKLNLKENDTIIKAACNSEPSKELSQINHDGLAYIFSFLTIDERLQAEHVCKKWKEASQMSWYDIKNLDLNDDSCIKKYFNTDFVIKNNIYTILSRCGKYLTNLSVNNDFDSTVIPIIAKYCSNLIKLELKLSNYDSEFFNNSFSKMNKLECLVIPNYQHSIHENQPCIFESVTKSIKTFRFRCASGETLPNNFATEFARFNNLNILTLENWKIDNDIVELLEIKKDTLTHLSLAGSTFNDSKSSIGKLINLEYLNVGCTLKSLTNENLINIINNCCKLKYINISWCKDITKPTFMYLKNLKNLNDMLLSNVGIDDDIIKQFKNLKTLECAGSTLITDKSIRHILKNSPTLERLVIGGTNVTTDTIHYAIEIKKLYKDNKLTIILNGSVIQQYIENNSCRRIHCEAYQITDNLIVSKDFFEIMYLFMRCRFTPVQEIE